MKNSHTVEIASYDMGYFPETQDESTAIGRELVDKQFIATKRVIAGAFQDVFNKNWEESFMGDCKRISTGGKEIVSYKNRPFIEFGEMEEDFVIKNGTQHLVINQSFKVL